MSNGQSIAVGDTVVVESFATRYGVEHATRGTVIGVSGEFARVEWVDEFDGSDEDTERVNELQKVEG